MKKILAFTTALASFSLAAQAEEINVVSWGGAIAAAQMEAWHRPYMAETGVKINSIDADNPATPIKAQVESGNVTTDIADVEPSDLTRLCDEGLIEPLPIDELADGIDGSKARADFIEGGLYDCGVGVLVYSTMIAYRTDKVPAMASSADFFDLEKIPGKRGLRKGAKFALELALMADGVPPAEVYAKLATPEGVDRAFAKLDTIKKDVIWWEAGAQPPQLLADGEVVMSTAYNGRIFNAVMADKSPFAILWDNQILDFNLYVIPKGAPNKDAAWTYIKWMSTSQHQADLAKFISYGPPRKSAAPLIGLYKDGKTEMAENLPTNPEYLKTALTSNVEFWADHDIELTQRFNTWLSN
ncbi:polyamine ABC transporter substrate-binding protein [Paracoccus aminophilus]|uniref:Spermidine/putrescine transport system, substrate-binding protein n=1 Tax=Paracoccus aminophilus JCM 7686 TaxID=1367847 RepID=S5XUP7_PARAH|nr:ABC transporter substrate-binding protein [Paracoccus aminophilus]AGT08942.1 spermidine/putrescine transport system, substrate-binding protein [Paracoccus aminophilus JCM 7686]